MYAGVGGSFLPSTPAEVNEVWMFFFSVWAAALLIVLSTRALMVRARNRAAQGRAVRWTDVVVAAQAVICVAYLLWGISARLQGR